MKNGIYVIIAFIGFLMLCAECESDVNFYLSKVFGFILFAGPLYLSGALTNNKRFINKYKKQL